MDDKDLTDKHEARISKRADYYRNFESNCPYPYWGVAGFESADLLEDDCQGLLKQIRE